MAKAAAAVLVNPDKHANKTYHIATVLHTYNDIAAAFSEVLGKTVTYNQVPYEAAKQSFLGAGIGQWQVDAMFEALKLIDSEHPAITTSLDYNQITGEQPTSFKSWVAQVKGTFE